MKKIILILLVSVSFPAFADARFKEIAKNYTWGGNTTTEAWDYDPPRKVRERKFGISQEKLDMYRRRFPPFNFPKKIDELEEWMADDIINYLYSEYRFGSIEDFSLLEKVWNVFIHMKFKDAERTINQAISEYYKFGNDPDVPAFSAPLGSTATIDYLNGIPKEDLPAFFDILSAAQEKK